MITKSQLICDLRSLGLTTGDTATVHSFLGLFEPFAEGLDTIVESFQEVLGPDGTLIMPTYTIHFLSKGYYDHQFSPSGVGVLTEHFRKMPGVVRTVDPVYSHAVWGKLKDYYGKVRTKDILGPDSIFAKLVTHDAKHVLFGTTMDRGCTVIHHFERMVLAPYRFLKGFRGKLVNQGYVELVEVYHYARYLDDPVEPNFNHLEKTLLDEGTARSLPLSGGRVLITSTRSVYNAAERAYEKDPLALVRKP